MKICLLICLLLAIVQSAEWQTAKGRLTKAQILDRQQWLINTDSTLCRRYGADLKSAADDADDRISRIYLIFETFYSLLNKNKDFFLDLADCEGQVVLNQSQKAAECTQKIIDSGIIFKNSSAHAIHVMFRSIGEIGHRFAACNSLDQEKLPRMALEVLFDDSDKERSVLIQERLIEAKKKFKLQ